MTDYYTILSRAVAALDGSSPQSRAALFERARAMIVNRIEVERDRWTDADARAELANFDAAIDRIEADIAQQTTRDPIGHDRPQHPAGRTTRSPAPPRAAAPLPSRRRAGRVVMLGTAGLLGVLLIGLAVYAFRGQETTATRTSGKAAVATVPESVRTATQRPSRGGDDLEPGVDGGSTDAGLPYYLRRQAVYYRPVHPAGMIIVDRSQRFLYLVESPTRALRYGIGVGGECEISPGLYRIKSKSPQWPEWSPSPALLKSRNYPPRVTGGPGNPLGAYALYFESSIPGIHGTNAPRSIGQALTLGCFRLINDDVVDLEKRIAVGTGVVVIN